MNDRKRHRIASLRWMGCGVVLMGLLGGFDGTWAVAAAPVMRVSQQQIAEARASAGHAALAEGTRLYKQHTVESLRRAIAKFEEARQLFHLEHKPTGPLGEAFSLLALGRVYDDQGEKRKALDKYNQSLLLMRSVGGPAGEAILLNQIGFLYDSLGEKQKALGLFNQSLSIDLLHESANLIQLKVDNAS
jgi:tetratricopeptide (TPR) repeat protein